MRFKNKDLRSGYHEAKGLVAGRKFYFVFGELFLVLCFKGMCIRGAPKERSIGSYGSGWAKNFGRFFVCDYLVLGRLELVYSALQYFFMYEADEIERKRPADFFELGHLLARGVWWTAIVRADGDRREADEYRKK